MLHGADVELRDDLNALLTEHERVGSRTTPSALELAAPAVVDRLHEDAELDEARIGQTIGPYRLVRLLGAGGMGTVYLAQRAQEGFTQDVALKVVRRSLGNQSARERFERERQILANLAHPGIALLFDGGQTSEGQSFYTMEYVDGEPLTDYCEGRSLAIRERLKLLLDVAKVLAYAHQNLIVHRDIKPSNVLVTRDGRIKLIDFGLAKLLDDHVIPSMTQTGLGPMTPVYAAPEQFLDKPTTVGTDIYQFGVLSFYVLSGRLPYRADPNDRLLWARAVVDDEPMRLAQAVQRAATTDAASATESPRLGRGLSRDLDAITRKCLCKNPEQRYQSAGALISDLESVLASRPVSARRAGPLYFVWRFVQRRRYAVAATTLAIMSVGIVGAIALWQALSAAQHEESAARETEIRNVTREMLTDLLRVGPASGTATTPHSALEALDRGTERTLSALGANPRHRAIAVAVLAQSYVDSSHPQRARDLIQREMPSLSGLDGPELMNIDMVLARAELDDVETSERAIAKAEAIMNDLQLPPHSPERLAAAVVRVHLDMHAGNIGRAKDTVTRLMSEYDGPGTNGSLEFRDLIVTRVALFDTEDDETVSLLERARDISARHYGPDSPIALRDERYAISIDMLGSRKLDAKRLLDNQESRIRDAFGERSLDYADLLDLRCEHAYLANDFEESASCWTRALGIYEQLPDAEYIIAAACDNIAASYIQLGKPADALPYYEREQAERSKHYPPHDPNVAHARLQIANTRCLLGDFENATREWDSAIADFVAAIGPSHSPEADYAARFAACLRDGGRVESARSIIERHGKLDSPRKDIDLTPFFARRAFQVGG
jgi:serine/threonine-protein kinase